MTEQRGSMQLWVWTIALLFGMACTGQSAAEARGVANPDAIDDGSPIALAAGPGQEDFEEDEFDSGDVAEEEEELEDEAFEEEVEEKEWNPEEELAFQKEEIREAMDDALVALLRAELPRAIEFVETEMAAAESAGAIERQFDLVHMAHRLVEAGHEMRELRFREPELYAVFIEYTAIEFDSLILAEQYKRASSDAERQEIEMRLRQLLDEGFEVSQRMREWEAETIARELDQIRDLLQKRRERQEIIIDRRLTELLMGEDPYAW